MLKNTALLENKKQAWYLIFATIVIYVLSTISTIGVSSLVIIFLCVLGWCYSKVLPLCIWITTSLLSVTVSAQAELIIWCLVTIPYFVNKSGFTCDRLLTFVFVVLTVIMSYISGIDPNLNSGIIQIFVVLCYFIVIDNAERSSRNLIVLSLLCSGLVIGGITIFQLLQGTANYHYNRLSYNDNIRDLANAITFPAFWYFSAFMNVAHSEKSQGIKIKKIAPFLIFVGLLIILFLTGSRGNILAFVMAIAVTLIIEMKELNFKKLMSIVALVIAAVVALFSINLDFAILSNTDSADARFDIWMYYFGELFNNGPIRALFGFGPGILKRIAIGTIYSNRYAHSTLFDYIFTYGICGFIIISILIRKPLKTVIDSKDSYLYGLFVLVIFMYVPFGSCRDLLFHILLGICCYESLGIKKVDENE